MEITEEKFAKLLDESVFENLEIFRDVLHYYYKERIIEDIDSGLTEDDYPNWRITIKGDKYNIYIELKYFMIWTDAPNQPEVSHFHFDYCFFKELFFDLLDPMVNDTFKY
ncbi:MAG: hypothetical protein LBM99_01255 [Bacillales bacterium]|jgi:hypothetical protein|nr:hypothetical protein [Bacillales bacterium]